LLSFWVQKQKEKEIPITAISVGFKAFIGDGNASMKNGIYEKPY